MTRAPLLEMRGIEKRFGGVLALRGVDFDLRTGEVHALLGENGAGKSTLMNILAGVITPDHGEVRVDGAPVRFTSPRDAQASGIATIFQELDLVPGLDITANLFLGHERMRPLGQLDNRAMQREARERMAAAGVDIDVRRLVSDLSIGQRQLVAIAKALSYATKVLVMDEPTAALSATEAERLFRVVRAMRERGVAIVYISHRLEEVPRVADRVTVMRDGRIVGERPATAPQGELVRLLVGRPFDELFPPRARTLGPELLALDHARFVPASPRAGWQAPIDVSLRVHAGEIVGLAGVMGAGRTELLMSLYGAGLRGRWEGGLAVAGRPAKLASIAAARRAGLALVTDDRRGSGLVLRHSVARNIVMSVLRRLSPSGFLSPKAEEEATRRSIANFDIRPPRGDLPVGNLSGGNQQKVVFAKELLQEPKLLLLDEPTRGVDVGAKGEIYARLRALTQQGLGVLVASSELPELVGLCDRIIVMRQGCSVAEFPGGVDERILLESATGIAGEAA
jgi:ribose transport system ATP-binding protein